MEKIKVFIVLALTMLFTACSCTRDYNRGIDEKATEIMLWGTDSIGAVQFHDLCSAEIDSLNKISFTSRRWKSHISAYFYREEVYAFVSAGMFGEAIVSLHNYENSCRDTSFVSLMRPCIMSYKAFLERDFEGEKVYKDQLIASYRKLCDAYSGNIKRDLKKYVRSLANMDSSPILASSWIYLEDYCYLKRTGTVAESWIEYEALIRSIGITDDLEAYREEYFEKDDLVLSGLLPRESYARWIE